MPTWAITDDTKSIAIAQDGIVVKNIDKDIVVLRIIPANTGLNTTTTDVLSIEHDGEYATRIPYNDVTVSGVSPSSADDFRTKVLTILNNNGSSGSGDMEAATYDPAGYAAQVTVEDIQTTRNACIALLASSGTAITAGQGYVFDGLDGAIPTGISLIRVRGINVPGGKSFDSNAEAYVTALSTYVPCTYDVGTNTISGQYILYAALISQAGTDAPSVFEERINIMGEIPTFSYGGSGTYKLSVTNSIFDEYKLVPYAGLVISAGAASLVNGLVVTVSYGSAKELDIGSGIILTGNQDDILNKTYIEIKQSF